MRDEDDPGRKVWRIPLRLEEAEAAKEWKVTPFPDAWDALPVRTRAAMVGTLRVQGMMQAVERDERLMKERLERARGGR